MRRVLAPLLLPLLLLAAGMPAAEAAGGAFVDVAASPRGLEVDMHVDLLREGDAPAPQKLMRRVNELVAPPSNLVVLAEWTQPAVVGEEDHVAALGLVASEGVWEGVYWVDAGDASVPPRSEIIGTGGRILLLRAIEATYHFLGLDGSRFRVTLPPIPVLPERPVDARVAVGGAAVGDPWPGLPDVLFVSVWNLFDDERVAGFHILDDDGVVLQDWTAGGCTDATWDATTSEPSCRVLFTVTYEGAALVTWHLAADGSRVEHDRLDLHALRGTPYTFA